MAVLSACCGGQTIEEVLTQVESNNKTLKAAKTYIAAEEVRLTTGLNPDDPVIEADYMIGRPVSGGDQFDFMAVQAFDFPTAYSKMKDVASIERQLLKQEYEETRQKVLLKTKQLFITGIYLNRALRFQEDRLNKAEAMLSDYEEKLKAEQVSRIEVNKIKLQVLKIKTHFRSIESDIRVNNDHLSELNGGNEFALITTTYPDNEAIPDIEIVADSLEASDPQMNQLKGRMEAAQFRIALARAMSLPKFEAGYHYQSVLGQTFNGAHVGLSIPLWKNKNMVKAEQARMELGKVRIEAHVNEHHHHIKQMYEQYQSLQQNLEAYQEILDVDNNENDLRALFDAGQINFIAFAQELEYFYEAEDEMLRIERDYHLVLAALLKYQL